MARKRNSKRDDGRIAVSVYLGRGEDGKRRYKTVYGYTQKEADAKADAIKAKIGKGLDVTAERDSFESWAQLWLAGKKADVSEKQYRNCESCAGHLVRALGRMPIAKIKTGDVQSVINALAEHNPYTHKPTAKKTLTDVKNTAKQIFQYAIDNRVLDYNPAGAVRVSPRAPQEKRRALTPDEQRWITETPHRAQRAAMIMMYAGLRRGELLALCWDDIDFDARTITVNKAVEMVGGHPQVKPMTKTQAGMRVVDIPQRLADFLLEERKKLNRGKIRQLHGLVCPAASGELMSAQAWKTLWASYLTELNFRYGNRLDGKGNAARSKFNPHGIARTIPPITAHWLRHTFATLLYLSGVDILTAKEQLGHSDVKTTLQIYTHLDKSHKRKNISRLDAYLKDASQMQVSKI